MAAQIRKLQEDDIDGISELWKEFAEMREGMTGTRILNEDAADYFFGYATGLLQRKDTLCLVAEDEGSGEVVGYLIATKQRKPPIYHHTRIAYLSDVFVAESHRRQGIYGRFIDELKAWATREGITAIDVMIFKNNDLARKVYEKMGFEEYRIVMRQELDAQADSDAAEAEAAPSTG